jgi:class 3 adenylate cyclase
MADLPRGTVTFLFTDVEGSTALWERDRAAMRAAVTQHLALLREAIATHGGVAFKTVGDAVQAAFATAPAALEAAAEALDRFPDGVFVVDLSLLTEPAALVMPAEAFALPEEAPVVADRIIKPQRAQRARCRHW